MPERPAAWLATVARRVALDAAIAEAMAEGPQAGLNRIERLRLREADVGDRLLHAARAALLRRLGRWTAAADCDRRALSEVANGAERRYLASRVVELTGP